MSIGFALFDVSPFVYIGYNASVYLVKSGDKRKIIDTSKALIENKIYQCYKFALNSVEKIVPFFIYDGYAKWKNEVQGGTYKEGRSHVDQEIKDELISYVKSFGGYHVKNNDEEADDVISSVKRSIMEKMKKVDSENFKFFIFTRDNDLLQLCDSKTVLYDPVKGQGERGLDYLQAKFGLTNFKKIVLYKICFGDSSDRIEGIFKGRRKKPILARINEFKNYSDFYAWDEVRPFEDKAKSLESIIRLKKNCPFETKYVKESDYEKGFYELISWKDSSNFL